MTTYYRDSSVQVTSSTVQVDGRAYPLHELSTVWHRDGARDAAAQRTIATRILLAIAPLTPIVVAGGVVAVAIRIDVSGLTRLALLLAAGLVALLTVPALDFALGGFERSRDRSTRVHELWGSWRGKDVMLVSTADRLRFGRIARALGRALEQHRPLARSRR